MRRLFGPVLLALAALALSGCEYIAPPRWVLWGYVSSSGNWIPLAEYRTLKACQEVLLASSTSSPPKCLPYGQPIR